MQRLLACVSLLLVALAGAGRAAPAPAVVVETLPGRVRIDWTAGRLLVTGGGAADLRAPSVDLARIGAGRAARRDAARRLQAAASALPLASGGTVGASMPAERLDAALALAREVDVAYASDGSTEVTVAVPLEALRAAAAPPPTPVADPAAPTALVIDARALAPRPELGIALVAGALRVAGPTVWVATPEAAPADPRAGDRPRALAATAAAGGALTVDLAERDLRAAAAAGALVIIVGGRP